MRRTPSCHDGASILLFAKVVKGVEAAYKFIDQEARWRAIGKGSGMHFDSLLLDALWLWLFFFFFFCRAWHANMSSS